MSIEVFATRDAALLRPLLRRDPVAAGYLLGDLEEPFFSLCRWFVGSDHGRPVGVVMVFTGARVPAVLSYGAPDAVAAIFRELTPTLPRECDAKIPLEHREAFASLFRLDSAETLWSMGLDPGETPLLEEPARDVRRLGPEDLPALEALYQSYPGNFFEPEQMERGLFFGSFVAGRLVSVAATHVIAPQEGVAVLGNMVTSPDERGRGHVRACTAALIEALRQLGCGTIALQVAESNAAAIAAYRRLGFTFRSALLQARCSRGPA